MSSSAIRILNGARRAGRALNLDLLTGARIKLELDLVARWRQQVDLVDQLVVIIVVLQLNFDDFAAILVLNATDQAHQRHHLATLDQTAQRLAFIIVGNGQWTNEHHACHEPVFPEHARAYTGQGYERIVNVAFMKS